MHLRVYVCVKRLNVFIPLWCTERVCLSVGWQKRGRYGAEWCVLWKWRAQKSNLSHIRLFIYSSPIFYQPACLSGGLSERMSPDSALHVWHFHNLTDGFRGFFFTLSWTYRSQIPCGGLQLACVWGKETVNPVSSFWPGNIKSVQSSIFFVHHMSKHSSNLGVWIIKKKKHITL